MIGVSNANLVSERCCSNRIDIPDIGVDHSANVKGSIEVKNVDEDENSHKETGGYLEKTSVYWSFVFGFAKKSHFVGRFVKADED